MNTLTLSISILILLLFVFFGFYFYKKNRDKKLGKAIRVNLEDTAKSIEGNRGENKKDTKAGLNKEDVHQDSVNRAAIKESVKIETDTKANDLKEESPFEGLKKSKNFLAQAFERVFLTNEVKNFYENIEEALLSADIGIEMTEVILSELKKEIGLKIPEKNLLKSTLKKILLKIVPENKTLIFSEKPHTIMIIGVNGAGKTTTIAKLCHRYKNESKKIIVGAADTFRAAATEQLKTWLDKIGVDGVFQKEGADPSAVAFDTVTSAVSKNYDICIIDTAGRLHTKHNLMEELKKMKRVIGKAKEGAPHDCILVLDGTQGQNALIQAKEFHQALQVTGLIVTKLDGTAKGGAVLSISHELKIPVLFIGLGESLEKLIPYEKEKFIDALISDL
jgi:fused signal recognition particle receptor